MRFKGNRRVWVFTIVAAASVAVAACKQGVEPINKVAGGLAVGGYDSVAYFVEGKPVEGSQQFEHRWRGATWRFANAANRDRFAAAPEQYAPQYGGYCAWAVGHGYTAKGDPNVWKIVDGKLYLNYNEEVRTKWEQKQGEYIEQADRNWPEFLKRKPEHKG